MKEEFLIYANQRRIAFNMEQFQHGLEEFADVESFVKHFPNVLEDWLEEKGLEKKLKCCVHCGAHFMDRTKPMTAKFCSDKCKSANWRSRHPNYIKNYHKKNKE